MIQTKKSLPYKNLCTEFYDLDKPSAPHDALAYYLNHAKKAKGPILEPMCGTGHFLIPMLEAGLEVTGFDNSEQMLSICKNKCQDKNLKCQLHEVSFELFKPIQKYKMIFIPNGSFCLLVDHKEVSHALNSIHEMLEDNGIFILEIETVNAINKLQKIWKSRYVKKQDGSLIILNHSSHFDEKLFIQNVLCRYEHWDNNAISQTEVEEFRLKIYRTLEIENLLKKHGFQISKGIKPYTNKKAKKNSEILLYECKKYNRRSL